MKELELKHGSLAPLPKQLSHISTSKNYQVLEPITTSGTKLNCISDSIDVFSLVRSLKQLNRQDINRIFGDYNGVRHRALCRIDGGHYDPDTL